MKAEGRRLRFSGARSLDEGFAGTGPCGPHGVLQCLIENMPESLLSLIITLQVIGKYMAYYVSNTKAFLFHSCYFS